MLEEDRAERKLVFLYVVSAIVSTISMISMMIVWQHWSWTLDGCIKIDCGCILYGKNTFNTFMGGEEKLCEFVAYGLIPVIVVGFCLGGYHGYRCCINRSLGEPRRITEERNQNSRVVVVGPRRRSLLGKFEWKLYAFLAILLSCLSLAHAVVLTEGFLKTCEQYKKNLIQLLGSRGREAEVIYHRLSCWAIFDFMDYLQPDANNWPRDKEINTSVAFQFAILCSWYNFLHWVFICILNILMVRKSLNDSGKKLCCCS